MSEVLHAGRVLAWSPFYLSLAFILTGRPSMHVTVMRNESAPQHIARSMAALELLAIIPNRSLSLVHTTHARTDPTRRNVRCRTASAC